ncbi:MAG: low molecular weight protein arginine phosphatase [Christensenellales bacterium]|jgi:protein tyrosine phosphatase
MAKPKNKAEPVSKPKKIRILFVCTGNTCRSAMAESIFRSEIKRRGLSGRFAVSSAGLTVNPGEEMNPTARVALTELGYRPHKHRSQALTLIKAASSDLIVCMTAAHKALINLENVYTVGEITGGGDVSDPYGLPAEEYIRAAKYIEYSVDEVLALAENLGGHDKK